MPQPIVYSSNDTFGTALSSPACMNVFRDPAARVHVIAHPRIVILFGKFGDPLSDFCCSSALHASRTSRLTHFTPDHPRHVRP